MSDEGDVEVGSAPTVAAADGEGPRTPSQQDLHDEVKGALFDGKPKDAESGELFAGRYRLVSLLGRGGMGEVYRAHDIVLGEDVALKFLPKKYARSETLMERFVGEARVARQVTHAHVCRVHDIGEAEGKSFLSMEFIDGEDLSSLLSRIGRLPPEKAYELAQQLCAGLAALHDKGVLHRDLKPSNVMIDGRGQLKILDFGLAAIAEELRSEELRDGTPAYMAPEQAEGKSVDERSDIYALGLVIYELITGRHAFESRSDATGKLTIDRSRTPADASRHLRNISPELDDVLQACLDPDPEARPSSVLSVALALPGGDPVAAAIAAGRAPSVDAIAGLKQVGYLPPWIAYACVAFIALSTLLFALAAPSTTLLGSVRPELPPEVLLDRAQTTLAAAGVDMAHRDSLHHSTFHKTMLAGAPDVGRPELTADGISPILLHYRQSPSELIPEGMIGSYFDPPLGVPGELRMTLDSDGLLRDLEVVPAAKLPAAGATYDFTPLHEAAGIDLDTLESIEATLTPRRFADTTKGWEATLAATGQPVRVEAASLADNVVRFEVFLPWDARLDPSTDEISTGGARLYIVAVIIMLIAGAIVWLARRSIKRGDADLKGALRVGAVVAVLHAIVLAGLSHHGGVGTELSLVFKGIRNAMFIFAGVFLVYLIVEPYARRFLPGSMVSWTRLVSNRSRDPLVARDVLIGITAAAFLVWFTKAEFLLNPERVPAGMRDLNVFLGARRVVGSLAGVLQDSIISILTLFLLLLLLRVIMRGPRRTMAVFAIALVVLGLDNIDFGATAGMILARLGIELAVGTVVAVVIMRFGLLAVVATQVTANLYYAFPITTDFDQWYASIGGVTVVVLAAAIWFGLRCVRPGAS